MATTGKKAYEGSESFVFVSYAHADKELASPLIQGLQERGFRVWYDVGIDYGDDWLQVIADHLERCACLVSFITPNYARSENCLRELIFAADEGHGLIPCYLADTKLPARVRLQMKTSNAILRKNFADDDAFLDALSAAKLIQECRQEEPLTTEVDFWSNDPLIDPFEPQGGTVNLPRFVFSGDGLAEPPRNREPDAEECFARGSALLHEKDFSSAVEWYSRAAELGHVRAQFILGYSYAIGRGVEADPARALEWYLASAEQGNMQAMLRVAECYESGNGTDADMAQALVWYEKAAVLGDLKAQRELALIYGSGRGVEADPAASLKWYTLAAEQGDADAQFNVGFCYDRGRGVQMDPAKAAEWYIKASREDPRAMFHLGKCYEVGRGVAKDPAAAVNCYSRAASRDLRAAQRRLSECYRDGVGVKKDRRKAEFWLKKSLEG